MAVIANKLIAEMPIIGNKISTKKLSSSQVPRNIINLALSSQSPTEHPQTALFVLKNRKRKSMSAAIKIANKFIASIQILGYKISTKKLTTSKYRRTFSIYSSRTEKS